MPMNKTEIYDIYCTQQQEKEIKDWFDENKLSYYCLIVKDKDTQQEFRRGMKKLGTYTHSLPVFILVDKIYYKY